MLSSSPLSDFNIALRFMALFGQGFFLLWGRLFYCAAPGFGKPNYNGPFSGACFTLSLVDMVYLFPDELTYFILSGLFRDFRLRDDYFPFPD